MYVSPIFSMKSAMDLPRAFIIWKAKSLLLLTVKSPCPPRSTTVSATVNARNFVLIVFSRSASRIFIWTNLRFGGNRAPGLLAAQLLERRRLARGLPERFPLRLRDRRLGSGQRIDDLEVVEPVLVGRDLPGRLALDRVDGLHGLVIEGPPRLPVLEADVGVPLERLDDRGRLERLRPLHRGLVLLED